MPTNIPKSKPAGALPTEPVLGVDVSKLTLDVCLLHEARRVRRAFPNTPAGISLLLEWLRAEQAGKGVIALEATGPYGDGLAHAAFAAGHRVLVFNPRRVREYARATGRLNKTDEVDADVIAHFVCSCRDRCAWWQPLPPAQAVLRELLRRQADLELTLHGEQRRLEVAAASVRPSLLRMIRVLEAELARVEKAVQKHLQAEPGLADEIARLRAIRGLGEKTARLLAAEIPRHFRNARAVAAWLGVVPRQHQSGTSVRKRSRVGHEAPHIRSKLYFPALTAMRWDPRCQALALRLRNAGHAPKSIVLAVLHKLIRTAFALLKTGAHYDPAHTVPVDSAQPCSP